MNELSSPMPRELALFVIGRSRGANGGPVINVNLVYSGPTQAAAPYVLAFTSLLPIHRAESVSTWDALPWVTYNGLNNILCTPTGWARFPIKNFYAANVRRYDVPTMRTFFDGWKDMNERWAGEALFSVMFESFAQQEVLAKGKDATAFPWRGEAEHFLSVQLKNPTSNSQTLAAFYKQVTKYLIVGFFTTYRMMEAASTTTANEAVFNTWLSQQQDAWIHTSGYDRLRQYVNYGHGSKDAPEALYGYEPWRLEKLRQLKAELDPEGLFNSAANVALSTAPPAPARYGTLSFYPNGNVTRVTIDNPPINLVDDHLISDLLEFLASLQPQNRKTAAPKVVIFDSANSDFFIGHIDLNFISAPVTPTKIAAANRYVDVTRLLQNITSTVFIGEVNGPKTRTVSFENGLGLVAGGGGQLFLGPLINKGRALEYLLAAKEFDGPTGAALGLFNSYYDTENALKHAVDSLAQRIGLFPTNGLNETKAALNFLNPSIELLADDVVNFYSLDSMPAEQQQVARFKAASGDQTKGPFELGLPDSILALYP